MCLLCKATEHPLSEDRLVQVEANMSSNWMKTAAPGSAEWEVSSNVKQFTASFCLL